MERGRIVSVVCDWCGANANKRAGHVNRSLRDGNRLFCGRACAGLARRRGKSEEQRRTEKSEYDRHYRAKLGEALRQKKLDAYRRKVAVDAETVRRKQRELRERQKETGYRAEYLRSERYKSYKHEYDINTRSREEYGDYAECHRLLLELEREIRRRCPDKYERLKARGYYERQKEKCRNKRLANRS